MRKKRDENYLISFINYPAVAPSFFFLIRCRCSEVMREHTCQRFSCR